MNCIDTVTRASCTETHGLVPNATEFFDFYEIYWVLQW